jgi:hypothetical protein
MAQACLLDVFLFLRTDAMDSYSWRCLTCIILSLMLGGCFPRSETRLQFDTGDMPPERWERVQKECRYEAAKASASAHVNIAGYIQEELYIQCLDLKGAKYKGKIQVAVE